ncbi:MAG TPA: hypothetical protein VFN26_16395 [Candidatus Acidoferrum sp.]|nr:hypothetical protein [Candidatus Acidoferrum sp.]
MKTLYLRLLLVLAGFAGVAVPAKAQAVDQLVVNIPFQFVAAGQTLPAGEYRVMRLQSTEPGILVLSSYENRASIVVLPVETEDSIRGKTKLNFESAGDQHFLSRIETLDHVYNLHVPSAGTLLAATPHQSGSASDSSAN